MTQDDPAEILFQGKEAWNAWCKQNPGPISFNNPNWYDCPGPGGIQLKGKNRIDFSGFNLSGVDIYRAFAEGLQLRDAAFHRAGECGSLCHCFRIVAMAVPACGRAFDERQLGIDASGFMGRCTGGAAQYHGTAYNNSRCGRPCAR